MIKDKTLTKEQIKQRVIRKKLLLWQGEQQKNLDRFILVCVQQDGE